MDIKDLFISAATKADFAQGAETTKALYDSYRDAGFKSNEALQLTREFISSSIESFSATQFMERQARGEFDQ